MQFDFTLETYKRLLYGLKGKGYTFQTFSEYMKAPKEKVVILRHDVDRLPENSLKFAYIQSGLGICGSYYFRSVQESWDEDVIKEIAGLGHEIGYHYENLTIASKNVEPIKNQNNMKKIYELGLLDFQHQLSRLRRLAPVETICMHGSPTSKFDNKNLWRKFNYSDFEIIGEPYFDLDFNEVLYLTDTGRRWNGYKVSIRDKINGHQQIWEDKGMVFRTSFEILDALDGNALPLKIMMTFHPQRWNDMNIKWLKELIIQNLKNPIKKGLILRRKLKILSAF